MLFVGDDWAEDHHDVYLMNDTGDRLASRRLPEGLAGIGRLHELIAEHAEDPAQVVIGIETDRGLWVDALTAAGYQVFAVNPLAAARYRDRHHVSGAKSDASDAKLLADLVRTDRHNHRRIAGDSGAAEAIKVLARAHQNLIWARTRHTNAPAQRVAGVLPGRAGGVRGSGRPRRAGHPGPRPDPRRRRAAEPVEDPLCAQSRWAPTQPRHPGTADSGTCCAPSSSPRPPRSPPRSGPAPAPRSASSPNSTARSATSKPNWRHILRHTRTPTSTAPCQDLVSSSAPGCSVSSGTTRTATPRQVSQELRRNITIDRRVGQANAPCWPATSATAASTTPSTNGPSAPCNTSPGARAFYDQHRAAGDLHHQALRALGNRLVGILHGCLRHHTHYDEHKAWAHRQTTPSRPLDNLRPWDVYN